MFAMTQDRLKFVDTSHTYLYMPVSILIPMPDSTVSVYAVFESFDKWVSTIKLFLNIFQKITNLIYSSVVLGLDYFGYINSFNNFHFILDQSIRCI
jgi:hypothetical protein